MLNINKIDIESLYKIDIEGLLTIWVSRNSFDINSLGFLSCDDFILILEDFHDAYIKVLTKFGIGYVQWYYIKKYEIA